jgi:WhiB family redox-sensing transcriptional regulator
VVKFDATAPGRFTAHHLTNQQSARKGVTVADINRLPGAQLEHWEWQRRGGLPRDGQFDVRPPTQRRRAARAKAICRHCPVITECLDHALRVREPYRVRGGRTEDERARILGALPSRNTVWR